MIKKSVRYLGAFFIVLFCVVINTLPAEAEWETGINVIPAVVEEAEKTQDYSAPEEFSAEVVRLVNAERANNGLFAFKHSDSLSKPANIRAQESAFLFAHKRPNGTSCSTVYSDCSLSYKTAGENLAYGYTTPADFVKAWMASQSHRENILSGSFVYAEAGFYKNADGVIYCSLILYTPKKA